MADMAITDMAVTATTMAAGSMLWAGSTAVAVGADTMAVAAGAGFTVAEDFMPVGIGVHTTVAAAEGSMVVAAAGFMRGVVFTADTDKLLGGV